MEAHTCVLGGDTMKRVLLLGCLMLTACGAAGAEPAPTVRPQTGKELCAAACARMAELTCEEALPILASPEVVACQGDGCLELVECTSGAGTKECVSCESFCAYQHDNGVSWNTACLASATTCDAIELTCNVQ